MPYSDIQKSVQDFFADPAHQRQMMAMGVGGAVGAGATGLADAFTNKEEDPDLKRKSLYRSALMGGVMGGAAGLGVDHFAGKLTAPPAFQSGTEKSYAYLRTMLGFDEPGKWKNARGNGMWGAALGMGHEFKNMIGGGLTSKALNGADKNAKGAGGEAGVSGQITPTMMQKVLEKNRKWWYPGGHGPQSAAAVGRHMRNSDLTSALDEAMKRTNYDAAVTASSAAKTAAPPPFAASTRASIGGAPGEAFGTPLKPHEVAGMVGPEGAQVGTMDKAWAATLNTARKFNPWANRTPTAASFLSDALEHDRIPPGWGVKSNQPVAGPLLPGATRSTIPSVDTNAHKPDTFTRMAYNAANKVPVTGWGNKIMSNTGGRLVAKGVGGWIGGTLATKGVDSLAQRFIDRPMLNQASPARQN